MNKAVKTAIILLGSVAISATAVLVSNKIIFKERSVKIRKRCTAFLSIIVRKLKLCMKNIPKVGKL